MDAEHLFGKLPEHSLLQVLTEAELSQLLERARLHDAEKGDVLLRQGDSGDSLIILLEGQARVTVYSANGREIVLEYVGAGAVLGEIALLDGGRRTASVIAMERLRYIAIGRAAFETLLAGNHQIALRIMRELALRLRMANQTIETDRAYAAGPRLARFMLRLMRGEGKPVIAFSQTELSMFAGISRENINRQLSLWSQAGVTAVEPSGIRIIDPGTLEEIAASVE
ncbi:Crp/Fnr family transcriptional regulator [Rhizorhapis suberifaciens]|uniref:CRP-like cAMP-binding protein n=1 Tax=Rhizorhapis suberifaciens TaxID=13656 RepID=A0A840HY05_9SPHN|nr:Crp/Fnr family transcriptional regulator [Rhizorhapis suberifaciens]MBB4642274.1 CRP-like cAMP-binding protein [Rhizorhapis suberifaciens]